VTLDTTPAAPDRGPQDIADAGALRRAAARRLRQWHARLAALWQSFDELDDAGLHALRKRIKRQRYAVEFFAPLLRRRQGERYLEALEALQERMGALNDAFVARQHYQALADRDASTWFALGWLAARIAELRLLAKSELKRLVATEPPARRASA
jgi:CHAD domain-containing protein